MVHDTLAHSARYELLHPRFATAFNYLRQFAPDTPDGRHPLQGDELFALVQSYTTASAAEKRFEAHRRYIDIQYVWSGEEIIGYTPLERLEPDEPYDPERDIAFFRDPPESSSSLLRGGEFAIYFPNDAHRPGCLTVAPTPVRKIVIKVAVST